ncbi:hypothetical protein ACLOJK_022755 [Asimina triloba]
MGDVDASTGGELMVESKTARQMHPSSWEAAGGRSCGSRWTAVDDSEVGGWRMARWMAWIIRSRDLPAATIKQNASEQSMTRWAQEENAGGRLCDDQRLNQDL